MDERKSFIMLLSAMLLVLSAMLMCGCKTVQYVPVEYTHNDTTYITKEMRDSIWLHDSVFVKEYQRGDTIYVEVAKWQTKYVERLRVDTMYKAKVDSVPVPYPVIKEVNKLRGWQKSLMWFGGCALLLCLSVLVYRFMNGFS